MSSNRGEKVLNSFEIGWTQDLRVQHSHMVCVANIDLNVLSALFANLCFIMLCKYLGSQAFTILALTNVSISKNSLVVY